MKKIAILGATGYVGRSLVREFFLENKSYHLSLFSRSKEKLHTHIKDIPKKVQYSAHSYDDFHKGEYDVIINCTGISSSPNVQKNPFEIFKVTEEVDALVITYLEDHPKALYINVSSGAVYGDNFETAVTEKSKTTLPAGFFGNSEAYAIAKINAEAKHRALQLYNIVDVRIFAFFGSLVDVDSPFLMSDIAKCIFHKKVFKTNGDDFIRDYITAKDLLLFITCCSTKKKINDYFDIYSKKSISKFALLQALAKKYKLVHTITTPKTKMIAKNAYFSKSKKATALLGYYPTFSSLEGVMNELDKVISENK